MGSKELQWYGHVNRIDDARWPKPVSYTHLDVYKRQEYIFVLDVRTSTTKVEGAVNGKNSTRKAEVAVHEADC